MTELRISRDLALPLDAVTGTFGILATKGAGKSNAAVVMAEEMYDIGVPWVAVDPKGDWWGMRSSGDGKGPGLPIVVFGGRHGDVPLEPTAGSLIADLVLDQRLTCVLDVSQFLKADVIRFLLDFGKRLFAHADDNGAEPLHLFLEEAHEYLPQSVKGDYANLVNVWQRIVKQGRFKGLGCTLISQRSSVLNKDVLELIDTLIVLRTIGPLSRKAIGEWVKDQDVDPALMASLPSLGDGEAWLWSPGTLHLLQRIQFRRRRTFDSGSTPKVGQARKAPATLADVDLAAIKEQMADTIEKAKADDPRELRKRIRDLERQLTERPTETVTVTERVEIIPGELIAVVSQARAALLESADRLVATSADLEAAENRAHTRNEAAGVDDRQDVPRTRPTRDGLGAGDVQTRQRPQERPDPPPRRNTGREAVPRAEVAEGVKIGKGERKVLAVLAEYPDGRTYNELAFLAGYSAKASTLGVILANLRRAGLVEPGNQPVLPTPEGLDAAGGAVARPTGPALLDQWLRHPRMGEGERKVLLALIDHYPADITHEELCEVTGYSPSASTMGVILSKLRKLGLVEKGVRRAAPEFMDAIA